MTKFIEFSKCIVPVDKILTISIHEGEEHRLNLFINELSNHIYEDFNHTEQRDARFEELKRMLCGEDVK